MCWVSPHREQPRLASATEPRGDNRAAGLGVTGRLCLPTLAPSASK